MTTASPPPKKICVSHLNDPPEATRQFYRFCNVDNRAESKESQAAEDAGLNTRLHCRRSPLDRRALQGCATSASTSTETPVWLCPVAARSQWWSQPEQRSAAHSGRLQVGKCQGKKKLPCGSNIRTRYAVAHTSYESPVGQEVQSVLFHYAMLNQLRRRHGLDDGRARVAPCPLLADGHHEAPVWDGAVRKHVLARVCEDVGEPAPGGAAQLRRGGGGTGASGRWGGCTL